MNTEIPMKIIARIHTDFPEKFGIPRQSGIVDELKATIVFEPEYRTPSALRGLEGFSHIWLIWQFSETAHKKWSPTVRPPVLGGNARMGVFATRSPFRPNGIGLSSVRLESIEQCPDRGWVLHVCGADLLDGTPIFDIKPYVPYSDCHPEATAGFTVAAPALRLAVECSDEHLKKLPKNKRAALMGVLAHDPRPSYQADGRQYGLRFAGFDVRFTVTGDVLTVADIKKSNEEI